ncbi:glycosyltransferase family 4 protein [Natranaeroarchaeum sulfidigenes]|nr:glycosyltransferase family 4 protein [Natranaeroarchaeum sulfidigenes]
MAGDLAVKQAEMGDVDRIDFGCWRGCDTSLTHDDVHVHDLTHGNTTRLEKIRTLKRLVAESDVVHVHHTISGAVATLLSNLHRTPVVVTEHNSHRGYKTTRLIVNNATGRFADRVVCVSDSVKDSFAPWEQKLIGKNKLQTIYNGVEIDRVERAKNIDWSIHNQVEIDPEAVIVSSAGMLIEQKAQHILIDAVDEANKTAETPIELVISGSGPRKEELQAQIDDSDFSDRMHLLGFLPRREQVYKMMHESDIYAMPSRWEGFCVAALEAMAAKTGCVFSNIEAFTPFSDVASIHDRGSSKMLAEKICGLAENESKRMSLSDEAKKLVKNKYSLESTAKSYLKEYCHIDND